MVKCLLSQVWPDEKIFGSWSFGHDDYNNNDDVGVDDGVENKDCDGLIYLLPENSSEVLAVTILEIPRDA